MGGLKTGKIFFLYCILLAPVIVSGQQMPGLSNSNYAGIHGVLVNPSQVADTRYGFFMTLGGVNFTANSSFIKDITSNPITYPFLISSGENLYETSQSSGAITSSEHLYINSEFLGPSFMVKLGHNTGFAVFSRYRSLMSGENIPRFFSSFYRNETSEIEVGESMSDRILLNTNNYAELGFSLGQTLLQHKNHFAKIGASYKRIIGTHASFLEMKDVKYNVYDHQVNEARLQVIADHYQFGYTNLEPIGFNLGKIFSSAANPGSGHGFDLGFSYEYRPSIERYEYMMNGKARFEKDKNKYKVRFNMALLDLGSIYYDHEDVQSIIGKPELFNLTTDAFRQIGERPVQAVYNMLAQNNEISGQQGFAMNLPGRFNLQLDYHVAKSIYLNLMMDRSLRNHGPNNPQIPSLMAITPRVESEGFELAFPVSFINGDQQLALGTGMKLGFLELGISNVLALIGKEKQATTNVYLGLRIFGMSRKKTDTDNDGVSDSKDGCPDVQGIWEFRGCPDSDLDGVEDKYDECPEVAGEIRFNGCPDTDGDGIPDKNDLCPYEKGLALYNGCPDTDNDGVPDYEDDCPALAGLPGFYGCPDTDGDGVPDSEDNCPMTPGLPDFSGCPDTDGDGIPDAEDECPLIAGSFKFNGCPDSDGDEVPDQLDDCPDEKGLVSANGCTDFDMDSVPDKDDQCPEIPGDPYNAGCPVFNSGHDDVQVSAEAREVIKESEAVLAFDDQWKLTEEARQALLLVMDVYKNYPDARILIMYFNDFGGNNEATADDGWNSAGNWSVANDDENLSEEKAKIVKQFILDQGLFADQVLIEQKWTNDIPEMVEVNQNSMIMLRIIK